MTHKKTIYPSKISQIDYSRWVFRNPGGISYGYVCVEEDRYMVFKGFSRTSPQSSDFYRKVRTYYDRFKRHMPAELRRVFLQELVG